MEKAIVVIGHDHGPVTVVELGLCGHGRGMGGERDTAKLGRNRVGGRGGTRQRSLSKARPEG